MTFGTMVTDQELSRMAPIEQELARVFAAELGHASPAEKPVCANSTEAGIDLGLSDLGGMIRLDLEKLLDGRLLFQGTSGAGKSWTLRRILEQTHGLIQQIVIDPEGEFVSLAQHCDYPVLDGSRLDAAARPSRLASSQSVMSNAYSDAPRQHQTSCGASRATLDAAGDLAEKTRPRLMLCAVRQICCRGTLPLSRQPGFQSETGTRPSTKRKEGGREGAEAGRLRERRPACPLLLSGDLIHVDIFAHAPGCHRGA